MKMIKFISLTAFAVVALPIAGTASAQSSSQNVEIISRDADGRAQVVRIDGKEYTVCKSDMEDSCINSYEAGFSWGNRPLDHWPGMPASEMDQSA